MAAARLAGALLLLAAAPGLLGAPRALQQAPADVVLRDGGGGALQRPASPHQGLITDGSPTALELCECEPARGSPNGLSCDKEGWFISNFQQAGQWLNGGGLVPLSKAICCRPCTPSGAIPGADANTTALAIVSMGCHASSNAGSASLSCEAGGGSFITGWSDAVRVPNSAQFYYPVGAADCCTPALLLSSGEARELERCGCVQENDISCGGMGSGRLLAGYMRWGVSQMGSFVPIAPALCCKSCVSERVIPTDACADLGHCSGHGVCSLGACECAQGWGGADCRHRVEIDAGGLPQWLISIIIIASCAAFSVFVIVIGKVVQFFTQQPGAGAEAESEEGEALREPLIVGLASDDEGSVGSEDSSEGEDEDDAAMPPPLSRRRAAEEAAQPQPVGGGVFVTPEELQQQQQQQRAAAAAFEISQETAEQQQQQPADAAAEQAGAEAAEVAADEATIEGIRRAEAAQAEREAASGSAGALGGLGEAAQADSLAGKGGRRCCEGKRERSGLPGVECSVCLNRPVQVAAVPCGHMCMCRRCSRRLQTCPVCRTRIIRRQRVFIGG